MPPISETVLEQQFIAQLEALKYAYRIDIRDRAALHANFRLKFEALNRVKLTDKEFERLLQQIITPDVFLASRSLREKNQFEREDGTPLFFELVNTKDWCKNDFEVINQLRMNTTNSFHRYDVVLLLNGIAKLPELLEAFEKHLKGLVEMLGKPGHMQAWDATQALVRASESIRHRIGGYCDEELAELLQRMTPGLKQENLSGDAIRMRRDRFRKEYPENYSWLRERIS